ncbi:hypothetical protein RSOL_006380, partial [Rhizoctonia solani AG-3 Rhs1AP]
MQDFLKIAQGRTDKTSSEPPELPKKRSEIIDHARNLLRNSNAAGLSDLKHSLAQVLGLVDASEARATLAEEDAKQLQVALEEKTQKKPRNGRVGRARVYTQKEIDEIAAKDEQSRAQRSTPRGRGRGRGRKTRVSSRKVVGDRVDTGEHESPSPEVSKEPESDYMPESE